MNSRARCVLPPTPHALKSCVREDRTVGWYGMRTQQRKQDHEGRMFTCRNGIAQVVTRYSSCELSKVSHETLFFEYDLTHINSTEARAPFVNHVPSLPRTQARGTCKLVLSSSVFAESGARIQAKHAVFVLPHLEHALFHWYTE